MKLIVHDVDYNNEILFEDGKVISLECQNMRYFSKLVSCCKGESSNGLVVLDGEKALDLSKDGFVLIDYYSLEQYSKTVYTKFYKSLDKIYNNDELVVKCFKDVDSIIQKMLLYVTESYDIKFAATLPTQLSDYLKFSDVKPEGGFTDFFESIINFVSLVSSLKLYEVLIFVNAKCFFDSRQLNEIIKCCAYNRQKTIFLESAFSQTHYENEIKLLIDEDFYDTILN